MSFCCLKLQVIGLLEKMITLILRGICFSELPYIVNQKLGLLKESLYR